MFLAATLVRWSETQRRKKKRILVFSAPFCPPKILEALPKFGTQNRQMFDHFHALPHSKPTAYLRNETSHLQTKMLMSIYNVSPKRWPTFHDFWPRMTEIRLLIVTHPSAAIT